MTDTLRITSLEMQNFLSVKSKISINLGNRGLVLVEGNNGAGKSACFVDALCYGAYGKTMRGVSKDDVVNRFIGKDCYVGLKMLSSDGDLIEIENYRKHSKYKDNVFFKVNGKKRLGATNDQTRDMIVKYLDMDFTAFTNSVVFGQSMAKYFSGLTDSEQKKVVDRLLGITWIPEAWDVAKEDLGDLEKEKTKFEILVGTKETQIQMKNQEIEEERIQFANFETTRADAIKAIELELQNLKPPVDITSRQEQITSLETEISNLSKFVYREEVLNKLQEEMLIVSKEKGVYGEKINSKGKSIKEIESLIKGIKRKIGTICPACGREITDEFAEDVETHLAEEEIKLNLENATLKSKLKFVEEKYLTFSEQMQTVTRVKSDISGLVFQKEECERTLNKINVENAKISSQKEGLERKFTEVLYSDNPYNTDKMEEDLQNLIQEQTEYNHSLDRLNDEIKYYAFWVTGFSNSGIKSLIIESMIPQMNQWASTYSSLFDSKFDVKFSAQTKLKKGDFAEKFDVMAFNKVGAQMYEGNWGVKKE